MDPVTTTALVIGITAVSAGASYSAAQQQNKAIRRSQNAAVRNTGVKERQLSNQASLEQHKRIAEAQRIRGRIRASQAEAGVGDEGSFAALERQADIDAALNVDIIKDNRASALDAIRAGLDYDLTRLEAGTTSSLLAGFTGGLTGLSTGLSISNAATTFGEAL